MAMDIVDLSLGPMPIDFRWAGRFGIRETLLRARSGRTVGEASICSWWLAVLARTIPVNCCGLPTVGSTWLRSQS
jgi:hypothetical protein